MKNKTLLILALLCGVAHFALAQNVPSTTVTKEVKIGTPQYIDIVKIESGTPPFKYQWQKNGVNIPDAINDRLYFPAISIDDAGAYTLLVTNSAGSKVSNKAVVIVATVAPGGITISFRRE